MPRLWNRFESPSKKRDGQVVAAPTALLYILAILMALLAVLVRYALNPLLHTADAYGVCLLVVVFMAWFGGFGPGCVALTISAVLNTYLFVEPRYHFIVRNLESQLGLGFFLFSGLGVLVIGEVQRRTRARLVRKMAQLEATQAELRQQTQRTEAALAQLNAFVRNAPYGLAFFDHELRFLQVNQTFASANGPTIEQHLGRRLTEVLRHFPPDGVADYEHVQATGQTLTGRLVTTADGTWEVSVFQVPIAGAPCGLGVIGLDVTQRVRQQLELAENASRLRQLTDGVPQLMWACEPTGECTYLSKQWIEYTGVPGAVHLEYAWLDCLHPEDREPTISAWRRTVERRCGYDLEFRLRRADGEYRWFAVRGIPVRDGGGAIVRWYGCCTDVQDLKNNTMQLERDVAERTESLRNNQIFLNTILDNVAEGIVACNEHGELQLFNAVTRRMHGLAVSPTQPTEWNSTYRLYEADGERLMPKERIPLYRALHGETVQATEMLIRTPGQPDRYVECYGQQLRAEGGRVFGAVLSMRDTTARREYERQLIASSEHLKASNQELEKFAYIASHDLQEPLRKIQSFGTRLSDKYSPELGEQGKDYLRRILDSAGRMRRLIEDLLAFSRITTKTTPFGAVNLNHVVQDVLSDLDDQITRTGGAVLLQPMPTVRGDASQLRQALQNLIGNALKFHRPGVPPVVRLHSAKRPLLKEDPMSGGCRITVADNGIGFDQQYAERIFELFQRLHGRNEYEGTGLGLAIVRKITVRHGVRLSAVGQVNGGAEFHLDWPQALIESAEIPSGGTEYAPTTHDGAHRR